jgi:hypothetical protein
MKPNLFKLATKELSQDAFIAWLLQWADSRCIEHNKELSMVATSFLKRIISLQGIPPEVITTVDAGRQLDNIDVWAKVNTSHFVIIEDKVGTGQHSDQLARYRSIGETYCKEHGRQLICIYIKTQSDSALNLKRVAEQGFAVFSRRDFLSLLEERVVENDIYNDFRDRLRDIENTESQFDKNPIGSWSENDWKGFYQKLDELGAIEEWKNVTGIFGAFWCAAFDRYRPDGPNGIHLYMQIERGELCFKVGEVYEDHKNVREKYREHLMDNPPHKLSVGPPGKYRKGKYMTIAIVPRSVWLGSDDSTLDFEATLDRLNQYNEWLEKISQGEIKTPSST